MSRYTGPTTRINSAWDGKFPANKAFERRTYPLVNTGLPLEGKSAITEEAY